MLTKVAAFLWFSVAILLSACSSLARPPQASPVVPVGEPEIVDVGPSTEVVNNCGPGGGTVIKHPSRTMISSHAVEWQVAGQAGIGTYIGDGVIPGGVNLRAGLEGRYVSAITEGVQKGIDWELPAEPNTVVEYTLMWREVWQPGYIDVRAVGQSFRIDVRYRTDIQSDIVGKRVQQCGGEQAAGTSSEGKQQPTPESEALPELPTPVSQPVFSFPFKVDGAIARRGRVRVSSGLHKIEIGTASKYYSSPYIMFDADSLIKGGYSFFQTAAIDGETLVVCLPVGGEISMGESDGIGGGDFRADLVYPENTTSCPSSRNPSSSSRPSGVTVPAGGIFSPTAGWTWICTGDFSVIRSDGNEIVLHDDLENTGLVLVLELNSEVTAKAPYGGRCEPFSQEEKSNAISAKVSYLMNGEGCGGTCSKVNVKELNRHGDVMRDYWRP